MIDYKDKVQKLLSLARSDNDNEARAALLKAKELMAEHKLTEADLKEMKSKKVVRKQTGIVFTMWSEAWLPRLVDEIAKNYCCVWFRSRKHGAQKGEVVLVGFEDDYEICRTVMEYAVDCVRSRIKKLKKQYRAEGMSAEQVRGVAMSYGDGFTDGLSELYEKQREQHQEWGLVLVTPKEVKDELAGMKTMNVKVSVAPDRRSETYRAGKTDGENFDVGSRLDGGVSQAVGYIA